MSTEHHPTHTWEERNIEAFQEFANIIRDWKATNLRIVDIGPGGLAQSYAPYFPKGSEAKLGFVNKTKKKLVNALESRARDKPDTQLVCYEANELVSTLSPLGIESVVFVDKFKKVLDAVDHCYPHPHQNLQVDIERSPIVLADQRIRGTAVVALNVLARCERDQHYALHNILESVDDNGYLLISSLENSSLPDMVRLAQFGKRQQYSIYMRGKRPDKRAAWGRKAPALNEEDVMRRANAASTGAYAHRVS